LKFIQHQHFFLSLVTGLTNHRLSAQQKALTVVSNCMNTLLTITFILFFFFSFGQRPTNISGTIVDENGKPIANAVLHYSDTAYTDKQGRFKVAYPNPQQYWYYFHIERKDFLPKSIFVALSSKNIVINKPIVLRSRMGFWYDPKKIDSTHIGMTVKEAIKKYKLDIDMCLLWDEPPGAYHNFTTELADSSYACFTFQGIFTIEKRLKMKDILDRKITGIGISFTNGTEKIFGNGFARDNPYLVERQMKTVNQ